MSRYINMDDAITYPVMPIKYRKYQTMNLDDAYEQGWYDLQNLIEKMPTADVRENVRGEWIEWQKCTPFYIQDLYKCSKCNESYLKELVYFSGNLQYRFCPNCGADMRKEVEG